MRALFVGASLLVTVSSTLTAQATLPALPDSSGWGVHVLTATRDPRGDLWVGTYGKGIFRLRKGTTTWERIAHDTSSTSISWDFIHAIAFGPRGQIWYGTVGNGWGMSTDDGVTWKNWTFQQLGPEWQYVTPEGIVTRGDTTWVGTADGVQLTTNDGASWTALVDSAGPAAKGPADTAYAVLNNEYIRRLGLSRNGIVVTNLKGNRELNNIGGVWLGRGISFASFAPRNRILVDGRLLKGTPCGLRQAQDTIPCFKRAASAGSAPAAPKTTWFRRPIDKGDNTFLDQTYRYGSTMGGNFQQHQGVEFNNPDGTPVYAIGTGRVVYAGRAEQGALTVAIRHDTTIAGEKGPLRVFSVYYHNSSLVAKVGDRVSAGTLISRVGNSGRATNDHMHLEVHAAPGDDVHFIVDSLEKFPPYTTNPELWIEPIAGTGIVAGQVFDAAGKPVPQARIYGIVKPDPVETPFSYAETYGDKAHSHPLYGEHFAVSDVPPGSYVVGVEIAGKKVLRRITVEAGKLTWVVFKP